MSGDPALRSAIEATRADAALGRSAHVRRLFDYLAQSSLEGRSPKESEVAIEVFGRPADFDPGRDSIARVYVHKLRQRLDTISNGASVGLTIPRGEYRLVLRDKLPAEKPRRRTNPILFAAMAVTILALLGVLLWVVERPSGLPASQNAVWQTLMNNGKRTIIVLGDYYIFADMNSADGTSRLVREYTVNSVNDLDRFIKDNPQRGSGYTDLGLHYLPVGSADVLRTVSVILGPKQDVRVIPASRLTPTIMRDSNVIYIGYFSGMGMLRAPVFAGSRYAIAETYDDLIDTRTRQRFESGGGAPGHDTTMYDDYGYISTFAGPTGNRYIVITGTRDTGLTQMGQYITSDTVLSQLAGVKDGAAEALFGVKSLNEVNFDSRLIHISPLDQSAIWNDRAEDVKHFPEG